MQHVAKPTQSSLCNLIRDVSSCFYFVGVEFTDVLRQRRPGLTAVNEPLELDRDLGVIGDRRELPLSGPSRYLRTYGIYLFY